MSLFMLPPPKLLITRSPRENATAFGAPLMSMAKAQASSSCTDRHGALGLRQGRSWSVDVRRVGGRNPLCRVMCRGRERGSGDGWGRSRLPPTG